MTIETALVQLIYVSSTAIPLDDSAIGMILQQCRRNNPPLGVTGLLVSCEGQFFQVLEGPRQAVEQLYATIQADSRHRQVVVLLEEDLTERQFAEWSMAHQPLAATDVQQGLQVDRLSELPAALDRTGSRLVRALLLAFLEQTRALLRPQAPAGQPQQRANASLPQ